MAIKRRRGWSIEDRIQDHRQSFIGERQNNLYLYVTKGTNFYDLDSMPRVDILDSNSNPILGLEDIVLVSQVKKGVYKVTFGKIVEPVPTTLCFINLTGDDFTFVNSDEIHGPTKKLPEKSSDEDNITTLDET